MAKPIKLKDRLANQILPVTRATLVEMNDGLSLQTAYDAINSTHYTKTEINAAGYLQSFTETDPTVPSHVKSITQQDITNWNNKLDTFTETDPSISSYLRAITEQDINNWNNAVPYDGADRNSATLQTLNIQVSKTSPANPSVIFTGNNVEFTGTNIKSILVNNSKNYKFNRDVNGDVAILSDFNSYVSKTELNAAGYISSFTETDPIYSASAAAGITTSDISNWNSKTDNVGTITGITMNGASKGTSGVVDLGTVLTSHQSLSSYATSANYDSSTKKIYLKNGTTTLSEIDATDFIKDGMVETAYVQGSNLVISFNTDAGKEAVNVPISNIFNANNYYTKTEINDAGYLTSFTETDPTVPTHVKSITEQNITNWNTAHTNSHTHSNKTVIDGITSTDISNWNSKTDNVGTITGITMNGASKGTSGVVDLGTIITSHQSLENYVTKSELNSASYLQSFTETDPTVPAHVKSITQQNITDWNNKLSSETQLSKGTTTGSGNAVTDITVSNHQITLTKGSTFLTSHQDIKTINNNMLVGTGNVTINELPTVTSSDNGKVLQVVNGVWTLVSPVTLYSGTGSPDNSQGNNGDLYMQI